MTGRIESYRAQLRKVADWDAFLQAEACLPGPRANLELLAAVIEESSPERLEAYARLSPAVTAAGTAAEFLAICGTAGLGRLAAEGRHDLLPLMRQQAGDPRWRVREAVAIGLQRWGDANLGAMTDEMQGWAEGNLLEQRAVVAALCEPRLLRQASQVRRVLELLARITAGLAGHPGHRQEDFRVLRQALGYGWSVAVAALPEEGRVAFERLRQTADPDVQWVVRENLKKKRMQGIMGAA